MHTMTIDIGGTFSKIMIFEDDEPIESYDIETRAALGVDFLKADIFEAIKEAIAKYNIEKVGISTAGIVDNKSGKIIEVGGAFKGYAGFNWISEIKKEFDLPAVVENDVKCAALGEYNYGGGRGYDNIYVLTVGTGIGGCYIHQGEIFNGSFATAGEIGYIPREDSNIGHLASTRGLVERGKDLYPAKGFENGLDIFTSYKNGDDEASELIEYMAMALAELVGAISLIIEPELILIGGAISKQKEVLLDPIDKILEREFPKAIYKNIKIITTKLENQAACYGAKHLCDIKLGD